jgi:peptidoglycan hydrolase CwlO-like protein
MAGTSVAVVFFGASLVIPTLSARADPIATTRAQIQAVQAQIQSGAAQVHALTRAFQQANLTAMTLDQQVAADRAQIAQLQNRLSHSHSLLRRQALLSYTGGVPSGLSGATPSTDPSVRSEYLQVAVGDLNDALDQFRSQQRQLSAAEANLAHQQRQSQAAANSTARARQQALAAAAGEQAQLDQLQSQLSHYVEAAAVAAQRQAAANAAAAAAAAAASARSASSATSGTQGLPVNNGLQSVVHSIVITPPPTPAAAPARPLAPAPAPPPSSGYVDAGGVWLQLRLCESSDNYAENTGNGFYGAYQFSAATWSGLGLPGRPDLESHQMQDQAAMRLQAQGGWGQWPACAAALGLR